MQNDPLVKVDVDETEDTEWNDILRQHGVIPERAPSPTAQLEEALEEALVKQHENRLDGKDLSDLEELEDDEDEEFLEIYKRKRMAEIQKLHEKAKYGQIYHVNKPEYNKEITECSMGPKDQENGGVYVFVHMSLSSKLQSRLLDSIFRQAAIKFPQIKFVDIPANRAIENYPDSNCPTLIVYYRGEVLKNLVTLLELGGNDTTLSDLEKLMVKVGAVDQKDDRLVVNLDDEESREERFNRYSRKGIKSGVSGKFNVGVGRDSEDEDFFD
ncbi:LANO_0H17282g1_1 [Lachancea nothofagi CBS 11611]|uniref:LANO_0H17282g1_1 n=1 Tax=Lachancea nothofagi CBS 11611 TaxID=1266666 RepID=A0A1G4KMZ1_9SACH|nr:LANO_0H17282g1_1 [Lachancea nothofagi CBS 11611]